MAATHEQAASMTAAVAEETAWLSYPEAQRYSGLGRTKLWQLISSGEVQAAKIGRAVRISRRSLNEHMERNAYSESKK